MRSEQTNRRAKWTVLRNSYILRVFHWRVTGRCPTLRMQLWKVAVPPVPVFQLMNDTDSTPIFSRRLYADS